ncbi:MAG: hypothetical protein RMI79_00010 [Nitrososphaerota archaeon]|nr:hypothetical protein [Nitrososphaerota archaeon]
MSKLPIILAKAIFYFKSYMWIIKRKKAYSMQDVLKLFYMDFLKIDEKNIEIIKLDEDELITRCNNPCPILRLSERLKLDTKYICREISEPVCKFVLSKLNPNLVFERNYEHIRPYAKSCEERIYWKNQKNILL